MRRRWRWPTRWRLPRGRSRRRAVACVAGAVLLFVLWRCAGDHERHHWPREAVLAAIRRVESGGRIEPPDGDEGLAIGPYQIHEVYWRDAVSFDPSLGGTYQECRGRSYAERVVDAYMRKWIPGPWARGEAEVIARVHNGGPKGTENAKTARYWERVRAQLP